MKRILRNVFSLILIASMLLCVCSCTARRGNNDGMTRYSENGLKFALPEYMEKISVSYSELCYGNSEKNLEVMFYFLSSDTLFTQLYLQKDCTVKEYADWFVSWNGYEDVSEIYDVENATIVLEYIYEPEQIYFCDYILRNEHAVFHMTMSSDAADREIYAPIFEEWRTYVSLDY